MGHAARTNARAVREGRKFKLEITVTPDGVLLGGPIDNKDLCLKLLFDAKAALEEYHKKKLSDTLVVPPHIGVNNE